MFDSDKYYDCKLDKLSSFALDRIRPPPPSLKRRILQKQISVVLVLVLLRIEYEKGREAVKELFQLFYTPAFSVYACHLHRSALLLFFFFSPLLSSPLPPFVIKNSERSDDKENKFRFSVEKSRPEMEWLDTGSRSTAGKYRFYDWTTVDTSNV